MWIFELFSVCDWITPTIETGKDVAWVIGGSESTTPVSLDKYQVGEAKRQLAAAGITVVSETTAWGRAAMLDIPDSQVEQARRIIDNLR